MMLMGMYLDEQILNTISDSLSVKSLKFDIDTSPEKGPFTVALKLREGEDMGITVEPY